MSRQARHFKVTGGRYDGARSATITIEPVGKDRWNMTIRPYRRQRTITLSLSELAEQILWRDAKERARSR